ncbi:hypothetical protein [Desulfococcus multivorans]|uniref:Guanylate cyclase domain-containing protein n=1 Tax=Desulfococcus multivorans DSM 2059 TaxID=1121405 RepID=S7VBF2_DESML|nr:hypothetical protein [Desulfococcus multivorans]AOY59028.1 conserved uncharacterized protein [Desulfococcus multivorans]AQV01286.1 hypothetical protein B2D07_11280 [Desulfococcus multivorans]EPR44054.1 hypothetical protein dsmv_3826 [Desulfococcus multivorans DSM 2059]SKA29900.1 hypothetical protein SAMN02745446_03867 [Desulfococcus multivorans DSM 2059]
MIIQKIEIPFSTDKYEKRLIIFIDLLGFKNYILSDGRKEDDFIALTSHFQKNVSEGAKYIKGNAYSYSPTFNFFSDTIIISFPLELFNAPAECKKFTSEADPYNDINIDKLNLLFSAVMYICDIQLHSLKHGLLSRGCVTIGDVYHNKNTWFGPGLIEAYEHESKIAIYPRVILSKNAHEYFKNEVVTNFCQNLIIQDLDGLFYVNYIAFIHSKFNTNYCNAHCILRDIIDSNIIMLRSKKKQKLKELQKWEWLSMYFNTYSNDKLKKKYGDDLAENIGI